VLLLDWGHSAIAHRLGSGECCTGVNTGMQFPNSAGVIISGQVPWCSALGRSASPQCLGDVCFACDRRPLDCAQDRLGAVAPSCQADLPRNAEPAPCRRVWSNSVPLVRTAALAPGVLPVVVLYGILTSTQGHAGQRHCLAVPSVSYTAARLPSPSHRPGRAHPPMITLSRRCGVSLANAGGTWCLARAITEDLRRSKHEDMSLLR
jgi:hypothetical protein